MSVKDEKQKVWNFARNLVLTKDATLFSQDWLKVFLNYPNYSDIEEIIDHSTKYNQFQEVQLIDSNQKGIITRVNDDNTWITIIWEDTHLADTYPRSFLSQECKLTGRICNNVEFKFEENTNG